MKEQNIPFLPGRELCRAFFKEEVLPILNQYFPGLPCSAGLLGYGSDVLGYDDETSTDHMWGPRFYLFLREEDLGLSEEIFRRLSENLPASFRGRWVHFSPPDPMDHGVRHACDPEGGPVQPLCWIQTFEAFFQSYLGIELGAEMDFADWLSFSEHRLLALSKADWYLDQLGLAPRLAPYAAYPDEIRRWLLASQWSLVAEEQAFAGRCAMTGDQLGSRLVAGRIVSRLMRICLLCARQYAPYSKWLGTAFGRLSLPEGLAAAMEEAVAGEDPDRRADQLATAQLLTAEVQNRAMFGVELRRDLYFSRPIPVVWADRMAEALARPLTGPLARLPLMGSMSQLENLTALWDNPAQRTAMAEFYRRLAAK